MVLTGQILDNETKKGIPYASVQITDDGGANFLGGTAADEDGLFLLDKSGYDGSSLYVTAVGYLPVLVSPDVYNESAIISLEANNTLPVVYVTPPKTNDEWLIWLLLGGGVAVILATGKKEKRLKGIPELHQNQWIDIALKLGIPLLLYFLVIKPILEALNLLPDPTERAQNESDKEAQDDQEKLADSFNAADGHSHTQAQLDAAAVALRNSTTDWWGYNWDSLSSALTWIPGMRAADARYFLGTFVKKNGQTLYRWYVNKFQDATILKAFDWDNVVWENAWGGTGGHADFDYSAYFNKMGINEDNANDFSWAEVVNKFISYVYSLAGITKQ